MSNYFLGQAPTRAARLWWEHNHLAWLTFDDALARLEYAGGKEILRRAHQFILDARAS